MTFYLLVIFFVTFTLTWALRLYALKRHVLDIPNARSAHTLPMPRGGGVAFVIGVLVALPYFEHAGFLTPNGSIALVSSGIFIASLGFLDDHGHVPSAWRLLGHLMAGILALYWVGGMPALDFAGFRFETGFLLNFCALFYLAWLINLYNFMDGIDGLAGIEAFSVCLGMSGIYVVSGEMGLIVLPLVLASSVLGFLCWNFPSARIFMGDAGSGCCNNIVSPRACAIPKFKRAARVEPRSTWTLICLALSHSIVPSVEPPSTQINSNNISSLNCFKILGKYGLFISLNTEIITLIMPIILF